MRRSASTSGSACWSRPSGPPASSARSRACSGTAKLRYPASLEDVDFTTPRGLVREVVLSLGTGAWIRDHHNLVITGPTGIGKSFLACAFVERACRHGFSAVYVRAPRLLHDLAVSRGDGSYSRLLTRLAKTDLLAIDDWLLAPLKDPERRDLLEVIEDRASTLIAGQIPPTAWHEAIGQPSSPRSSCAICVPSATPVHTPPPPIEIPSSCSCDSWRRRRTAPPCSCRSKT
jgi:hypothetical protein